MKVRIIKFIQCAPCSINGPKFLEISIFEILYIAIGHLVLVTLEDFFTLITKLLVVKILRKNSLFKCSLWVHEAFFLVRQTPGEFSRTC